MQTTQPQSDPITQFSNRVGRWVEFGVLALARHWLWLANGAMLIYVGLPFLAPWLLANGHTTAANTIYRLYSYACHQIPSRAYYVAGEQVALCHRDVAIYGTLLFGGLAFGLVRRRLKPLAGRWYLLLILPMALDGGLQLVSEAGDVVPPALVSVVGLAAIVGLALFLHRSGRLGWPWWVVLGGTLLGLGYVQFIGPYHSDVYRRTLTGFLFGFATVWLAYPYLEESFCDIRQFQATKLARKILD